MLGKNNPRIFQPIIINELADVLWECSDIYVFFLLFLPFFESWFIQTYPIFIYSTQLSKYCVWRFFMSVVRLEPQISIFTESKLIEIFNIASWKYNLEINAYMITELMKDCFILWLSMETWQPFHVKTLC